MHAWVDNTDKLCLHGVTIRRVVSVYKRVFEDS